MSIGYFVRAAVFGTTLGVTGIAMGASIAYTNVGAVASTNTSSLNIGREFVVSGTGITILDLGVYDATAPDLINSHVVTLFAISNIGTPALSVPLASTLIPAGNPPAGATLDSGFYFNSITPMFLAPGDYAVVGYGLDTGTNGSGDPYADGGGRLSSPNAVDAFFDPYEFSSAPSPVFPANGDSNDHSSTSFHFNLGNTTPEPASLSIVALGAIGMLARNRRS